MADNCYVVEPPPSDNPPRTPFRRAALSRAVTATSGGPTALRNCFPLLFCPASATPTPPPFRLLRHPNSSTTPNVRRAFFISLATTFRERFLPSRDVSRRALRKISLELNREIFPSAILVQYLLIGLGETSVVVNLTRVNLIRTSDSDISRPV